MAETLVFRCSNCEDDYTEYETQSGPIGPICPDCGKKLG